MEIARFESLAKSDRLIRPRFQGGFTLDTLPKQLILGQIYMCSDQNSDVPVSHFRIIFSNSKYTYFFCSFGTEPSHPEVLSSLESLKKPVIYNKWSVQYKKSICCPYHCLFVAYLLARDFTLEEILQGFYSETDSINNDARVKHFISTVFGLADTPPIFID